MLGMDTSTVTVSSAAELADAIASGAQDIVVDGAISGSPSITLPAGATLRGGTLEFLAKGVRLSKDNTLRDLTITTLDYEVAVYNDPTVPDAGTMRLENVTTVGQVYLAAEGDVKNIRVEADGVHVKQADVRGRIDQPHGYGVDVLQGGFTLWNRQPDTSATFSATLKNIKIGTETTPVRGCGVFVGGYADREGKLTGGAFTADLVHTGDVFTDGGIANGTPDKITGGVFVISGAKVKRVENAGRVTTHGPNDMVLDNWGDVDEWVANAQVTSTGPSGIGFVNFGNIGRLEVNAPIVTTGSGARGFNLYDGSLREAEFDTITTSGDGSIGIQVSKPLGSLKVRGNIETQGGEGMSLVKGVQTKLKAIALSVKDGGDIDTVEVGGAVRTRGDDVTSFQVTEKGIIKHLKLGSIEALGARSQLTDCTGQVPSIADVPTRQA